uniref:ribosomal protein L18 n=1 Tax=Galdieria phlegrea TaxID=1389228 RepID=UPI0023D7E9DE|nr:ribosomal protein L18 [Galdieria phlegrea]UNJ16230.1 ribosomal protein L18 [Galdieria sp.]WDA99718.1 ribosomal protein L18 [Galdieria sulphuraria]WDA99910.1 ribosomal protein L18 [Galdieria phlegrea]
MKILHKNKIQQRHKNIRKKIKGNFDRPRLYVFRSNQHIYAQIINDENNHVMISSSTVEEIIKNQNLNCSTCKAAQLVGKVLAEKCKKKNISKVVFDRGVRPYHGRIKALAESARENGLIF